MRDAPLDDPDVTYRLREQARQILRATIPIPNRAQRRAAKAIQRSNKHARKPRR